MYSHQIFLTRVDIETYISSSTMRGTSILVQYAHALIRIVYEVKVQALRVRVLYMVPLLTRLLAGWAGEGGWQDSFVPEHYCMLYF